MVYCVTVSSSRAGSLGEKFFEWSCKVRYYVRTFIYVFVKRPIVQFVCKTISIKYTTWITLRTDYGHTMAKSLIICSPNSNLNSNPNPIPKKYLGFGYTQTLSVFRNNGRKHGQVPKWVLINCLKIPLNAPKFICPNCLPKPKSFGFRWKKGFIVRP